MDASLITSMGAVVMIITQVIKEVFPKINPKLILLGITFGVISIQIYITGVVEMDNIIETALSLLTAVGLYNTVKTKKYPKPIFPA